MLVLKRREKESLYLGNNIKVTILGINKTQIKIGIDAPKEIAVYREELYEKVLKNTEHQKHLS